MYQEDLFSKQIFLHKTKAAALFRQLPLFYAGINISYGEIIPSQPPYFHLLQKAFVLGRQIQLPFC
jgi:hypothetical protein